MLLHLVLFVIIFAGDIYEAQSTEDENIYLRADDDSVSVTHPTHGGAYGPNELRHWIIQNEDPSAVGFKIEVDFVDVEECCDKILIEREDCAFAEKIISTGDGPFFVPGLILNITFMSDFGVNLNGFTLNVSAIYDMHEPACPGHEKAIVLHDNETSLQIRHPETGGNYKNNEQYIWMITNDNSESEGFEIRIDELEAESCCDWLTIQGEYCSYRYERNTFRDESPISIRGNRVNVTWTTDSTGVASGFLLNVRSVQEINKTHCYEYTCDDFGRCVREHNIDYLSWSDSQAACEAEGARLVIITDEEMNELVNSVISNDHSAPWIGLSGISTNSMKWTNGKSPSDYEYSNWIYEAQFYFEQPYCGAFFPSGWHYRHCSLRVPYVCELL